MFLLAEDSIRAALMTIVQKWRRIGTFAPARWLPYSSEYFERPATVHESVHGHTVMLAALHD